MRRTTMTAMDSRSAAPVAHLISFLGAPGAGKGTQGALLAQAMGVPHVSVGDLVRDAQARGLRLRRDPKTRLIETAATVDLLLGSVATAGSLVLDGFPRSADQVSAFAHLPWPRRTVMWLEVSFEEAISRMRQRGRPGEDLAQISYRHMRHDHQRPGLIAELGRAGIPVEIVEAGGSVESVHAECVRMLQEKSTCVVDKPVR